MASNDSLSQDSSPSVAWRHLYEAVLRETDTRMLFKRVEVAEAAILTHREALQRCAAGHGEHLALDDALANLAAVKKERLRFR